MVLAWIDWHTSLCNMVYVQPCAVEGTVYKMHTSTFATTTKNNLVWCMIMLWPLFTGTHLPIISETTEWEVAYSELARLLFKKIKKELARLPVASDLWNWLVAWFIGLKAFILCLHGTVAMWCWEDIVSFVCGVQYIRHSHSFLFCFTLQLNIASKIPALARWLRIYENDD